ncbi:MazF family transcriptional regulator [Rhodopseudomonas palustris]|uniref:MazF family transcriptional regulator n=1 Tax=Rhodopseudomonas palustris TaxID=1076 RepID=A0A323UHZ7_RHOPL|nr:AbrB/MazE/SpoVT family DNA-binding domain-containing protein [Rhodopseudomonas palustris]PZA12612.1 MazF family transcriptional regulator [Rhodopseudomonas palustris]
MKVKVAKWGNSLGIRLPSAAAQSVGATAGSELVLTVENGELRLKPSRKTSAELLAEMLDEIKRLGPKNEPETVDWGPDRGAEIIDDDYSRGLIVPGPDGAPVRVEQPLDAKQSSRNARRRRR